MTPQDAADALCELHSDALEFTRPELCIGLGFRHEDIGIDAFKRLAHVFKNGTRKQIRAALRYEMEKLIKSGQLYFLDAGYLAERIVSGRRRDRRRLAERGF